MSNVVELKRRNRQRPPNEGPISRETFWARGLMMIQSMFPEGNAPVIWPGSPEFDAWRTYFLDHLHWRPWAFEATRKGDILGMTVPAQWPEWFDKDYAGAAK